MWIKETNKELFKEISGINWNGDEGSERTKVGEKVLEKVNKD